MLFFIHFPLSFPIFFRTNSFLYHFTRHKLNWSHITPTKIILKTFMMSPEPHLYCTSTVISLLFLCIQAVRPSKAATRINKAISTKMFSVITHFFSWTLVCWISLSKIFSPMSFFFFKFLLLLSYVSYTHPSNSKAQPQIKHCTIFNNWVGIFLAFIIFVLALILYIKKNKEKLRILERFFLLLVQIFFSV